MQDYVEELLDFSWQMGDSMCDGRFVESEISDDDADIDEFIDI